MGTTLNTDIEPRKEALYSILVTGERERFRHWVGCCYCCFVLSFATRGWLS